MNYWFHKTEEGKQSVGKHACVHGNQNKGSDRKEKSVSLAQNKTTESRFQSVSVTMS